MVRRKNERATYAPQASRDLLAAIGWIKRDNPAAARALRRAVDDAAMRIARHPELGRSRPNIASMSFRFLTLTGFPYIVFYNADRRPPRILRILHGARDLPELLRDV
jgi:toxin ParE1/3/4